MLCSPLELGGWSGSGVVTEGSACTPSPPLPGAIPSDPSYTMQRRPHVSKSKCRRVPGRREITSNPLHDHWQEQRDRVCHDIKVEGSSPVPLWLTAVRPSSPCPAPIPTAFITGLSPLPSDFILDAVSPKMLEELKTQLDSLAQEVALLKEQQALQTGE